MKRYYSASILLIVFWMPATSAGAVFARDWKTPGDGLLTYDDVNQRELLDLSVSRLDQFAEPRLQNAVAQIAPGGLFEGFSFANRDDVTAFAQSAGIDITTLDFAINNGATKELVDLLGVTAAFARGTIHAIGFIDETELPPPMQSRRVGVDIFVNFSSITGEGARAGISISASNDLFQLPTTGLMLYRAIPEPSSVYLAISAVCILATILFHRQRRIVRCATSGAVSDVS